MNIGFFSLRSQSYNAHVLPFIDNAPDQDYNFYLFHLKKIFAPNDKDIFPICPSIDLSYKINILKELRRYKLDYMIFFSPGQIFTIFLTDLCKQLSIKTIYFQHGLSLDLSSFDFGILKRDNSVNRKIQKYRKYFLFYIVIMINIMFFNKILFTIKHLLTKTLHLTYYLFRKKKIYLLPKYGLNNAHCDYAFVYGQKDKSYLIKSMKMDSDNIVISGYPFLSPTMEKSNSTTDKRILFLSNAFRTTGVLPISIDQEKEFYHRLYKKVTGCGYTLDIKVHPSDNYELIQEFFAGLQNINIYKNKNLADLTIYSDLVISDFSTALFYSIKYFKPIIILISEYFESYPFDYSKYGIGIKSYLDNIDKIIEKIPSNDLVNKKAYQNFLQDFLSGNQDQDTYKLFYSKIKTLNKG